MNWIRGHEAAVVTFVSAAGVFVHATFPDVAAATGELAGNVGTFVAFGAAVVTAYQRGALGK